MKKIFLIVCFLFIGALAGCNLFEPEEKEFSEGGMSLTLTDDFIQSENVLAHLYIVSNNHIFMGNAESKQAFIDQGYTNLTLKDYIDLVLQVANKDSDVEDYSDSDTEFKYAYYESNVEGKDYSYMLICMESNTKFYTMNFGCLKKNFTDEVKDDYLKWAKTIRVE